MSSANRRDLVDADVAPAHPGCSDDDQSLLGRISLGHQDALHLLMHRHWASLVGYAAGITFDRDIAQDVVQGTFVQIWAKRSECRPSGMPRAYLYRITRNLALNARRDGTLRQRRQREWGTSEGSRTLPRTPEEDAQVEFLRSEIDAAIAALPERRREIFLLSRYPGLTHREIAETMGISLQTVSNQMSTALGQLRAALSHHLDE